MSRQTAVLATILALLCCSSAMAGEKPLKVYILAGQSNMEGQANISTFDYIGDDPATAPMLKEMRGPDGKPVVCEKVWISHYTANDDLTAASGKLTAGYGGGYAPGKLGSCIGPEFTFGIYASKAYDGPILLIKTAWGGKSLNTDFRPPSAGPYEFNAAQLADLKKQGKDIEQAKADKAQKTGHYYRLMIDHVKKVLADPKRVVPDYNPAQGYEIAGFAWFQGWNDMCDGGTYPDSKNPDGYAKYGEWMADFIRDVRKDLNAPKMRFSIAVIGVGGDKATGGCANLRPAMAAPAEMPEFKGNVAAVQTAPFWDYEMEALGPKKNAISNRLSVAHLLTSEGVMEERDTKMPGWEPIGKPAREDRTWRFTSFDRPAKDEELLSTDDRILLDQTPDELKQWYMPDFDDSKWNSGKAPIGKGKWRLSHNAKEAVKCNSAWGDGGFLLARTTFEVDQLNYEAFRLSILARGAWHVYLNGHKISTWVWWKNQPAYLPHDLTPAQAGHLKKGTNVLAVYANARAGNKEPMQPEAALDVELEGISKAGLDYVKSEKYVEDQMDKICTRQEAKIIKGCSNAGFHYLGSAKILGQIGKALAEALVEMEKK